MSELLFKFMSQSPNRSAAPTYARKTFMVPLKAGPLSHRGFGFASEFYHSSYSPSLSGELSGNTALVPRSYPSWPRKP